MRCLQRAKWQALLIQQEEDRKSWQAFHATLEPLPELKEIPAEVRELIVEQFQPNEVIDTVCEGGKERWCVDEDLLQIFVIDRDRLKRRTPLSGRGRILEFARRNGNWFFVGEGGWVS
jgi:hypothetical protein